MQSNFPKNLKKNMPMTCVECDGEIDGPKVQVIGDLACSIGCARDYEKRLKESFGLDEVLWKWLYDKSEFINLVYR